MSRTVATVTVAALLVLAGCSGASSSEYGGSGGASGGGSVGVSVGGAQDANAFRNNVQAGYVPQPTDITYQGLFHDYYFDTGTERACRARFCPSYSRAVSRDPLSGETERYLTVGLNSGISTAEFERPPLNLVVVVDTSGSMSESMRSYYYDTETAVGDSGEGDTEATGRTTKMAAARSALRTLVDQLGPRDRLGIVAYDDSARVVRRFQRVGNSTAPIDRRIDSLSASGGTNLDAGMRTGRSMLTGHGDDEGRETRIVYLTDAMPNLGQTGGSGLSERLQRHAADGIHSTFVGIGVDFNSRLTEAITDVRGGNYYTVDSAAAFRDRMSDGFQYMVTPLAFDLSVTVESSAYEVVGVYGTSGDTHPSEEVGTDRELLQATTLFPSRKSGGKTEGGVILLELRRVAGAETDDKSVTLNASYETPDGTERSVTRTVEFPDSADTYYETTGIRKAVALTRYATLVRNWAAHQRALASDREATTPADGIVARDLGKWEQRSVELAVSATYRQRFREFRRYFTREMAAVNSSRVTTDLAILRKLASYGSESPTPSASHNETATATASALDSLSRRRNQ